MSNQKNFIIDAMGGRIKVDNIWADIALLTLRLYTGITIMKAGLDKIPVPDWMVEQVVTLKFPAPEIFAWLACFSEFGFGLLVAVGLMTRLGSFMVGFTMAVAAFGFQKVGILTGMHIAQGYVWAFFLLMIFGAGRISLDYMLRERISNSVWAIVSVLSLAALITFSFLRQPIDIDDIDSADLQIESLNVPGSFNGWDPGSNEMEQIDGPNYSLIVDFDEIGPIEFKFTANGSWDYNLGEADQEETGFPLEGIAEYEDGSAPNIKAYIPDTGSYVIQLNVETYKYSLNFAY